jgi:hypothetical protein
LWILPSLTASLFVNKASNTTDTTTATANSVSSAVNKATDAVNPAADATSTASVMAKHTSRALKVFQEEDDKIIQHLCNPERSVDPPSKPTKVVLYNLLQKYLVMSGKLNIKRMDDGEPFYKWGSQ